MIWLLWALLLMAQNYSFTYVSRARNSGSLARHVKAAIFSNGIWFGSQMIIISKFMDYVTGKHGWQMMAAAGLFYTTFTIVGSVSAHYFSMKTETGKAAVGASAKYAQIPIEEWQKYKSFLDREVLSVDIGQGGTLTPAEIGSIKKIVHWELAAQ